MSTAADLSNGTFIRHNGELVQIIEFIHRTPGNLRAFYQAKMRNAKSGKLAEYRFGTGESVEIVRVEVRELQYLYKEDNNLVCMDNETFEQHGIPSVMFGDAAAFMIEGMQVLVSFEGDDNPIGATPPNHVELEITYTEPGVRGNTATNTLKPATVSTGAEIRVPLFVNIGDKVKIDLRTIEYMERVK
ncbi:MAG: elongation factor P [Bacteroidia bacterium]|nr:elongation factor P [Bacteroidia bacterium]